MARLTAIEGIGDHYARKLEEAGITSTDALLTKGATREGRREIVEKTGISDTLLIRWINHTDLFRIRGVSSEYAELLEAAGVDTLPELAQRRADNLAKKLEEVNATKGLVRKMPSVNQVTGWIEQAKSLPRVILY